MSSLPDLDVRSLLDVVTENFQSHQLKTYAIRMVYIGEHTLPRDEITKHFEKTIHDVNSGYCDINVHGLLLVYDNYFLHIIEGSEDTVHRQLRFLLKREIDWIERMNRSDEEKSEVTVEPSAEGLRVIMERETLPKSNRMMFKRLKMLMLYHSVKTLLFEGWRVLTAQPPQLVGKLDIHAPLSDHMEQLRVCLDKTDKLCYFVKSDKTLSFQGLSAVDPKMKALPEVTLLDYLLQSPYILDLRHTVHLHRRVDDYRFYYESVWPLPTHFTPRLLYKLKIDDSFVEPLPVMPWELVREVTEDEEKEERESQSSSSD